MAILADFDRRSVDKRGNRVAFSRVEKFVGAAVIKVDCSDVRVICIKIGSAPGDAAQFDSQLPPAFARDGEFNFAASRVTVNALQRRLKRGAPERKNFQ